MVKNYQNVYTQERTSRKDILFAFYFQLKMTCRKFLKASKCSGEVNKMSQTGNFLTNSFQSTRKIFVILLFLALVFLQYFLQLCDTYIFLEKWNKRNKRKVNKCLSFDFCHLLCSFFQIFSFFDLQ